MATPAPTPGPAPTPARAPSPTTPAAHGDTTSSASAAGTPTPSSGKKSRAGRRPSPVWDFFVAIRTEHNTVHAQCNFCERRCAGVAARMVHHIVAKCPAAPSEAVDALGGEAVIVAAAMKKRKTGEHQAKTKSAAVTTTTASTQVPQAKVQAQTHGLTGEASDVSTAITTTAITTRADAPGPASAIENVDEQQVATAHQKLVLACILNDIPLQFVEDEALMDAFVALRPDFPHLTLQMAQTSVLEDVHRAVMRTVDASLRGLEQVAIIHRHHRQSGSGLPDLWLGVDGKNEPLLLGETSSSINSSDGDGVDDTSSSQPLLQVETAMLGAQCARFSVTTTLSFCTGHAQLFYHLRQLQHQHARESSSDEQQQQDDEPMPSSSEDNLDQQCLSSLLLGTCLLHQTVLLQKRLLQLVPSIVALLQEATVLVYSLMNHPRLSSAIRSALLDLAHASSIQTPSSSDATTPDQFKWDLPARLVRRLLSLESELRAFWTSEAAQEQSTGATAGAAASSANGDDDADRSEAPAAATNVLPVHRDAFWDELRQVDALLAPFNWAFALSESSDVASSSCNIVTSAQYLVLWLWLVSIVNTSATIPADQKDAFTAHTVSMIRRHVADHQLACMLLDPRVHGAGLSATGKRKVKALVVKVAERVFPEDGFQVSGTSARTNLLAHLGHYSGKTAQFADDIAWEMSAGKAAELFWNDYVEDARELAKVARAVLKFIPHTQSAASLYGGGSPGGKNSPQQDDRQARESFAIRQIKQLYAKKKASSKTAATHLSARAAEEVMAQYANILLPIGLGPSASTSVSTVTGKINTTTGMNDVAEDSRDASEAATSRILLAMAQQIQSLLSASSSDGSQGSESGDQQRHTPGEQAEEQQATNQRSVEKTSEVSSLSASSQEESVFGLPVDASWLAFEGESDRKVIEAAVRRFVFPSVALVVV